MYTSVMSAYLMGLEAVPVQVEVDVSDGLPGFYMVGYVSTQVRETCSRVRTALRNERVTIPPKKITVNLSPGDLPKSGTGFDLPVAAGILEALGRLPAGGLRDILVAGELGLDGKIHGIRGVFSMVWQAARSGCRACVVPKENLREAQALAGGGRIPVPGEITLAHRGVLFLDEFPEMDRRSLQLLRQPLEEREIWISRTGGRFCFPAAFLLVAAMNPCPCGQYPGQKCVCTPAEIARYQGKISRPLLDRMDLCAATENPTYREIRGGMDSRGMDSAAMGKLVRGAWEIQRERYRQEPFSFNGEIPAEKIRQYCRTDAGAERLLEASFDKMELGGRGCHRILRTARTSADLEGSSLIRERHMAEAINYRMMTKGNGGMRI